MTKEESVKMVEAIDEELKNTMTIEESEALEELRNLFHKSYDVLKDVNGVYVAFDKKYQSEKQTILDLDNLAYNITALSSEERMLLVDMVKKHAGYRDAYKFIKESIENGLLD